MENPTLSTDGNLAERVAGILRDRITVGRLVSGTRLAEETIGAELGVSRNTLREAFRLLTQERLLTHELNRGVSVRTLTERDVVEIFRVRRLLEPAALRALGDPARPEPDGGDRLAKVAAAVIEAEQAAEQGRWPDVGTADLRFHGALVELAGSARIEEFMARILAELRLVFHVMKDPRGFHEPYIARNREILTAMENGDVVLAEQLLEQYLDDAERELIEAYAAVPRQLPATRS
jgi:DNA-binding GntR family transcriptional regulator